MRSGWFFGTEMWAEYLTEYAKTRPECLNEWKSSPLADDHDFSEWRLRTSREFTFEKHQSQVIDLRMHKWSDVRKSYRGVINGALRKYSVDEFRPGCIARDMGIFKSIHAAANGRQPRNDQTYVCQKRWMNSGNGMLVMCSSWTDCLAAAYWIIYQSCAYYMSGPSLITNIQHAVIWKSLQLLKARGVLLVDMGQIDGETEKERNIGTFKTGFGGEVKPFVMVRRV